MREHLTHSDAEKHVAMDQELWESRLTNLAACFLAESLARTSAISYLSWYTI